MNGFATEPMRILHPIVERRAGGYLRDLTRRTEKGEFAIGPMLMAHLWANGGTRRHVS